MNLQRSLLCTPVRLLLLCLVLWTVTPAFATRYVISSTAEYVADSDFIFVGSVLRSESFHSGFIGGIDVQYTVQPTRTLRGSLPPEMVVRGSAVVPAGPEKTFAFFANRLNPPSPGIDGRVVYGAIKPLGSLKEIEKLIDYSEHPEKYIDDPAIGRTEDFLLITSSRLRAASALGGLPRERLIAHYRACLEQPDPKLLWAAVQSLLRIEDAASATVAVKLLSNETTAPAGAYFLARHPVPEAIKPLCDQLDRTAAEEISGGETAIIIALMRLNARDAVPAIRRAVERGLCGESCYALGFLGDAGDLQLLLPGLNSSSAFIFHKGLVALVSRSNLPVEPWMKEASMTGEGGFETKAQWKDWIERHKATVKIEKTGVEAGLKPPVP